jgi:hypothetical protein
MFIVFDGVPTRSRFGLFFRHAQNDIHPLGSPFSQWVFRHGI